MLEKIVNISASSDYKNHAKTGKQGAKSNSSPNAHFSLNDSISFSPAVVFMTNHYWKLNFIDKENEKTVIDFELDGTRFVIKVSEIDLVKSQNLEYLVTRNIEAKGTKYSVQVRFVSFVSPYTAKLEPKPTLPAINNFLIGLMEIHSYIYQLSENHALVQESFTDREESLQPEFEYLNSCIINFLETYLSTKFNFQMNDKSQRNQLSLSKLNIIKI